MDLKKLNTALEEVAETRQLPKQDLIEAFEIALAAAYRKEYGKDDQKIKARFNTDNGEITFFQVKKVVEDKDILGDDEPSTEEDDRVRFNSERHIHVEDAKRVQMGIEAGEDILFPLENKVDFGRIAAQAAKSAITQKLNEVEREAVIVDFEGKEGTIVSGTIQRIERGNYYIDLGRTVAILPFSEQIKGERFRQGERIRAYVSEIDSSRRKIGGFIKLSRSDPRFVVKLFEQEVIEMTNGSVKVEKIARESGVRSKIAVSSSDPTIDPVGALVGQRGVRVLTVKSELGEEQIDIIEYFSSIKEFASEALLPAEVVDVEVKDNVVYAKLSEDQIPVAIGRGGQNIKLASKLIDTKIYIVNMDGEEIACASPDSQIEILKEFKKEVKTTEEKEDITNEAQEEVTSEAEEKVKE